MKMERNSKPQRKYRQEVADNQEGAATSRRDSATLNEGTTTTKNRLKDSFFTFCDHLILSWIYFWFILLMVYTATIGSSLYRWFTSPVPTLLNLADKTLKKKSPIEEVIAEFKQIRFDEGNHEAKPKVKYCYANPVFYYSQKWCVVSWCSSHG